MLLRDHTKPVNYTRTDVNYFRLEAISVTCHYLIVAVDFV